MHRTTIALRLLLPAFLVGAIVAISLLEAPLKFQAPGITIPLGLGIGRLVFTALNILTGVALAVLTLASLRRPRAGRTSLVLLGAVWVVYLFEVALIRPVLNRRSDLVIAGAEAPGTDWAHYAYIAADVAVLSLLIALVVVTARELLPAASAPAQAPVVAGRSAPQDARSASRSADGDPGSTV
ncbi:hypothetical protein BCL57_000597 [Agromyces flavus]|uniref:DUF4149 domain-containing protein n=1 Tax=Agromyces flavus TaxID=589382 RepID=A0A1H1XN94_9MICO|nr:hypothetical protein [Agromyces flavus]MCP2366455.1 hypothetical protein [Agromyces flavus]GGI44710.1 hypothetical protein GCM10010932_05980 [Agromyces flavus]SDT10299.1 hypothetical protein SAMN04489721_2523 [Agromyces flavus]